jgi:2-polyprenyl-6-methoxyphenol hydroxylase-like FAD-dependent oxidoreductase
MSPAGGIGINYAIQDAVAAANVLTRPLLRGEVCLRHLAAVQWRREWVTRAVQFVQAAIPRRALFASGRLQGGPIRLPWPVRQLPHIPGLRYLPGWLMMRLLRLGSEHVAYGHSSPAPGPDGGARHCA